MSAYKTMDFQADLWLPVTATTAARAIYEAATALLSKSDMSRIAERRQRLEARKREMIDNNEEAAIAAGRRKPMHPRWVAYQLGKILEPNAIVLDDAISNSDFVCAYMGELKPAPTSRAADHPAGGAPAQHWESSSLRRTAMLSSQPATGISCLVRPCRPCGLPLITKRRF
jgi:hypothetical protein